MTLSGDYRENEGVAGLDRLVAGQLRRRELLQAGAGTALALGLSACGIGRGLQGDTDRVICADSARACRQSVVGCSGTVTS